MIRMSEALRWLNQFDRSHLNGTNQRLFATARNRRTDNAAIQDIVRSALQQARTSPEDALDYPETLLNCAEIEYDRGFTEQARDHLAAAMSSYVRGKDTHGVAVAAWMFGIAEFTLPNTDSAYTNWKRSLRTFERYRKANRHIPSTRNWYTATVIKMNMDLVTLPQEAFTWINEFSSSRLSPVNRDLVELIDQNIKNGNRDEADRIINVLQEKAKTSPDPWEYAEIHAETGLARFRMREWPLAIRNLKEALTRYPAESHAQESVRWMLGAVQFWSRSQRVEALSNWEKGINGFTKLARQADQNNRGTQKRWYRDRIVYMKGALRARIAEFSSGDAPDMDFPEGGPPGPLGPPSPQPSRAHQHPPAPGPGHAPQHGASPEPTTPPSRGPQTDLYQNLLNKVGGDAATAERLINLERRNAPNASRDDLITRAIERWEHDNR